MTYSNRKPHDPKTEFNLPPRPKPNLTMVDPQSDLEDYLNSPRAGFWLRFVAATVDTITVAGLGKAVEASGLYRGLGFSQQIAASMLVGFAITLVIICIPMSKSGYTLGKKLLGIKVIHSEFGQHLSLGRAFFRESIGKMISAFLLMIGYLMAAGASKRALHDRIAKSLVVKVRS
jgi:uncharacterized RDD family membrane protein YckC